MLNMILGKIGNLCSIFSIYLWDVFMVIFTCIPGNWLQKHIVPEVISLQLYSHLLLNRKYITVPYFGTGNINSCSHKKIIKITETFCELPCCALAVVQSLGISCYIFCTQNHQGKPHQFVFHQ